MAFRVSRKKDVNIMRVIAKTTVTLIALYAGGVVIEEIGYVMVNSTSPFHKGLTLLGWTVGDNNMFNATDYCATCQNSCTSGGTTAPGITTCLTATNASGILAVVGIIGIASVVLEFVDFRF